MNDDAQDREGDQDQEGDLDQQYRVLRAMKSDQEIAEDTYLKGLIILAAAWAELGKRNEAAVLVAEASEAYLVQVLPQQMEDDPAFAEQAFRLAEILNTSGLANPDEDASMKYLAFMKPGQA